MTDEPVESLPLDGWHRAQGARMVPFAGYAMPIQYEGIVAEHLWTRESAGLFDVSHMGQLQLTADEAGAPAKALEALVPGDISGLATGKMRYSLLLNEEGGILDDLMITNSHGHLYLVVNGAVKWDDIAFLREHLPDEIRMNHMQEYALLALQGPKAVDALSRLIPDVADLYFMEASAFMWGGEALWISRSGYTGEDGFEICVPEDIVEMLAKALCEQPEVKPIGLGARDSLRLEAGLPLYGHDLNESVDPIEGSAAFAVSKRRRIEGGFHGAARVLKAVNDGPARKLVGFAVEGKLPVREGAELFAGDAKVGTVTSGGFSPSLNHPIGMAFVEAAHIAPGTLLEADVRGRRVPVTISNMPFVPHRYHRKGKAA
jgi:aminomethyltransferase